MFFCYPAALLRGSSLKKMFFDLVFDDNIFITNKIYSGNIKLSETPVTDIIYEWLEDDLRGVCQVKCVNFLIFLSVVTKTTDFHI